MPRVDLGKVVGDQGPQGVPGPGVPEGGDTGQILAKKSGTNLDTEWIDPPSSVALPVSIANGGTGEKNAKDAIKALTNTDSIAIGKSADSTTYSTAIGYNSKANGGGGYSVAMGYGANSSNLCTIAIGYDARSTNYYSLAMGMCASASGSNSVAIGYTTKSSGSDSVAIGNNAIASTTNSIVLGKMAATSDYGHSATALGYMARAYGSNSIAIGYSDSNDFYCIAIGSPATATGSQSIAIGFGARANSEEGSMAIGSDAECNGSRSVAIGYRATVTSSNTIQLGNASSLQTLNCRVNITTNSDERDKTDIEPIKDGAVDFLNKIKAIQYVLNHREMYIAPEDELSEEDKNNKHTYGMCTYDKEAHARGDRKGERLRVGVSAQETQSALESVYGSADYANIVNDNFHDYDKASIPDGVENQLTVNYTGFIPFLIKAIQELSDRIEKLEERLK